MVESKKHRELKNKAKLFLYSLGFKNDEIFEEFKIFVENKEDYDISLKDNYYADMVGKSKERFVIIECGTINADKMNFFRKIGELYWINNSLNKPKKIIKEDVFLNNKCIAKCISIFKYQEEFICNQTRGFNLSKFVQARLDEYMKSLKDYKEFIQNETEI